MSEASLHEYPTFIAAYCDFDPIWVGRTDVDFYLDLARSAGGAVLELGCGTGRILLPTARAGCRIAGLDVAEPMLAECRAKLELEPREVQQRVHLLQASMAGFELE